MSVSRHADRRQIMHLLQKLGWKAWLSVEKDTPVLLHDVLAAWLVKRNSFEHKGRKHKFSEQTIQAALAAVKTVAAEGHASINEKVYELLMGGKNFAEFVRGERNSFALKFIDWLNPARNVYHFASRLDSKDTTHAEIVLYVNGIPFVVLMISGIGHPEIGERIVLTFYQHRPDVAENGVLDYAQWLFAVRTEAGKVYCNAPGASEWSEWREDNGKHCEKILRSALHGTAREDRPATGLDRSLVGLLEPKRFMKLIHRFMLYDGARTKIVRYQQFETVETSLRRIQTRTADGTREGGTIWFNTGNEHDWTMVMLAKSICLDMAERAPLVLLVTNRTDLIHIANKAFATCGHTLTQARSGSNLLLLLQEGGTRNIVVTFDTLFKTRVKEPADESTEVFVLIDNYRERPVSAVISKIKDILPRACCINFAQSPAHEESEPGRRSPEYVFHQYTLDASPLDMQEAAMQYDAQRAPVVRGKDFTEDISIILFSIFSKSRVLSETAVESLKKVVSDISLAIENMCIRDWQNNVDIQRAMENIIEDIILQYSHDTQLAIALEEVDEILKACLAAARARF